MEEIGGYSSNRLVNFRLFYLITQMIGLTIIILVASWIGIHLNGLGISDPVTQFNWHPLLMTMGMVFLYGNSILIYRGFRYGRKKSLKLAHATIHAFAFLFTVIALIAVFDSHNYAKPEPIPNLYSLHSWVGLSAVIIFACQYVVGFFAFLFPMLREPIKEVYMPIHVFFGLMGFVLAIAASLMGLSEKSFFHMKDNIVNLPNEGLLINCIGLLLVVFGSLVVYLVSEKGYKRQALPEDAMLLTGSE